MEVIAIMIGIFLGVLVAIHFIDKHTSIFDIPHPQSESPK